MKNLLCVLLVLSSSLANAECLDTQLRKLVDAAKTKQIPAQTGICKRGDNPSYENEPPLNYVVPKEITPTTFGKSRRYLIEHGFGEPLDANTAVFHTVVSPLAHPEIGEGAVDALIIKFHNKGVVSITTYSSYVDSDYSQIEPPLKCEYTFVVKRR